MPKSEQQLLKVLKHCYDKKIIDQDAMTMIEGVFNVSNMQVRDSMIPRAQMVFIKLDQPIESVVEAISASKHSRFPVICEHKDDIIGILLAKDILPYLDPKKRPFDIQKLIRPSFVVPESKRLDNLLHDFQAKHSHMAIVVDEYGSVAGLITIEDILEKIVGDIEDESFTDESTHAIEKHDTEHFTILAKTPIEEVNTALSTQIPDDAFDTIGGLIAAKVGRIPKEPASIALYGYKWHITQSTAKQILVIEVEKI